MDKQDEDSDTTEARASVGLLGARYHPWSDASPEAARLDEIERRILAIEAREKG